MKNHQNPFDFSIIDAIKKDHEDLKEMISLLKENTVSLNAKKRIFYDFEVLLKSHTQSEEDVVYKPCLKKPNLSAYACEGYEEHQIADELLQKIKSSRSKSQWNAQVKVLVEVIERHLEKEESSFLPALEKTMKDSTMDAMVPQFVGLRRKSQTSVHAENAGVLSQRG